MLDKAEYLQTLAQLPDIIKNWIALIGQLEDVTSLDIENEILPDVPRSLKTGWMCCQRSPRQAYTVELAGKKYRQIFVREGEGLRMPDIDEAWYPFDSTRPMPSVTVIDQL